jgi:hypothetical protein
MQKEERTLYTRFFQQLFNTATCLPEIICLLISFTLSIISYFFYESNFLKLKNSILQ